MHITKNAYHIPKKYHNAVVAIGNFDGIHRAHQEIIAQVCENAEKQKKPAGIITFQPHPRTFFNPKTPLFTITPTNIKIRLLKKLKLDFTAIIPFNKHTANMEAENFIQKILIQNMHINHAITGYDFHFGKGRRGNPDMIRKIGKIFNLNVSTVEQKSDQNNAPFSSSAIRNDLKKGDVKNAAQKLGWRWFITGTVTHGEKRGTEIGFPTVNISTQTPYMPAHGIYAVKTRLDQKNKTPHIWKGAAYIGKKPTYDGSQTGLEIHLLDTNQNLYGKKIIAEFVDFIRPDHTFKTTKQLVKQMQHDCTNIRNILENIEKNDPLNQYPLAKMQNRGEI